jgi:hypothetical protein
MSKITAKSQKGQQVPNFTEDEARAYFEKLRWPNGPACVHCGSVNVYRIGGKSHRPGLFECRDCREQFTVTVGTVMEDTHLPLVDVGQSVPPDRSSKKGMSALQLQRNLGLGSYRTAWFLAHRIREAMRCEPVAGCSRATCRLMRRTSAASPARATGNPAPSAGAVRTRTRCSCWSKRTAAPLASPSNG